MKISSILSFISNSITVNIIGVVSGVFLLLAVFSNFTDFAFNTYFNSDTLYLPSVYKDLFIDKHSIKDWHLNPAPNFFPDMIVYFAIMVVSCDNFIVSSFVFSFVQYFSILLVFWCIFKLIMPVHYKIGFSIVFVFLSCFLLEYLFLGKDFSFTFYIISNSYHSGAFIMSMVALIIFLNFFKTYRLYLLIILFLFSAICIASDKLFIVLFCMPALCTGIFYFKKSKTKKSVVLLITILLSVFIGIKLFEFLEDSDFTSFDKVHAMLAFDNMKSSFAILSQQICIYVSEFSFKSFTIYLFIVGIILLFITFSHTRNKPDHLLLNKFIFFSICFDVFTIIAPIVNGNYTGYDTLRYNIYPLYYTALTNAIVISYFVSRSDFKNYFNFLKYLLSILMTIILCIGISFTTKKGLYNYFHYYPDTARKIDAISEKHQLKCGVANYWEAKKSSLFSKKEIKLYSVFEDLAAYEHVTNEEWFFSNNIFNYIILNNFKDTISFKKYFNKIEILENKNGLYIVKVPEFKYDKSKGYLPILINDSKL